MFRKLKIGTKIILLVSTIIVLLTALIALVTLFNAREAMEIQVATSLQNTLSQKQKSIQNYFNNAESNLRTISSLPEFENIRKGNNFDEYNLKLKVKLINSGNNFDVHLFDNNKTSFFSTKQLEKFPAHDKSIFSKLKPSKKAYGEIFKENGTLKVFIYKALASSDGGQLLVGLKLKLSPILDLIEDKKGIGETGEYLIAQNGRKGLRFINTLRKDSVRQYLKTISSDPNKAIPMRKAVSGKTGSGIVYDYVKEKVISAWAPLKPEISLGIVAKQDVSEAFKSVNELTTLVISVSAIAVLLGIGIILVFAKTISTPLIQLQKVFKELAVGKLFENLIRTRRKDEIGSMIHSVNELVSYQGKIVNYAQRVGNGDFTVASEIKEDSGDLSKALLNMTLSLKEASENELLRNWSIKGLAQFSDILRNNNDDMLALGFSIISNLVDYLDVNQGGLFVSQEKEDGTQVLVLNGYYAYNREKFMEKELIPGEGLVGQCFLEQERIHLTEVPQEYVSVTSGLGEATPESLLLIPLKVNDEVYGVIELASFTTFSEYQIEFVEKLGESIASTISAVKVAEKTKKLLDESTGMSDALQSQEEQLRQTMEEMQATQEEMAQNESYLQSHKSALSEACLLCEISLDGSIKTVNQKLISTTGFDKEDLIGKSINNLKSSSTNKQDWDKLIEIASSGSSMTNEISITSKRGKTIETIATFSPITSDGNVVGVISLFHDITSVVSNSTVEAVQEIASAPVNSDELDKAKEKAAKLREKVRELKIQLKNDGPKELETLKKENQSLKEQIESSSTNSDNSELENQLAQATQLLETLGQEKQAEINQLKSEIEALSSKSENDTDQSNNKELKTQLEQATRLLEALSQEKQTEIDELKGEIELLKSNTSEDTSESNDKDIKALSLKYQDLEKQTKELENKLAEANGSVQKLTEENQRMDSLLLEAQENLKSGQSTSSVTNSNVLLENSLMSFMLNKDLQFQSINSTFKSIFAFENESLQNKLITEIIEEYEGGDFLTDLKSGLSSQSKFVTDLLIKGSNDVSKWTEVTFTSDVNNDPNSVVLAVLVDISE